MNKNAIIPVMIAVAGGAVLFFEVFEQVSAGSAWRATELYGTIFFNAAYIGLGAYYLYRWIQSNNKVVAIVMSVTMIAAFGFWYTVSLANDPAFPTLAAMSLVGAIYLIPGVLVMRGVVALACSRVPGLGVRK